MVLYFPSDTTYRYISDVAHTYDGTSYLAELRGNVSIKQGMGAEFDSASFTVANQDGAYTSLFDTYTVPELVQATVTIYETDQDSLASTERQEIFRGKLNLPQNVNLRDISLKATHHIDAIIQQFNRLQFSPRS